MVDSFGDADIGNAHVERLNEEILRLDGVERRLFSALSWGTCIRRNDGSIDVLVENNDGTRSEVKDVVPLHTDSPIDVGVAGLVITLSSQRALFLARANDIRTDSAFSNSDNFIATVTRVWVRVVGGVGTNIVLLVEVKPLSDPDTRILCDCPVLELGLAPGESASDLVGRRCIVGRDAGLTIYKSDRIFPYDVRHFILAFYRRQDRYQPSSPAWPTGYPLPYAFGEEK